MKNKFCILIPVYNEYKTIGRVIDNLNKSGYPYLIVDDGSTDNSWDYLVQKAKYRLVRYPKNRGKGFAIKEGAKKIKENGYDYILTMDADNQHSFSDIPIFLEALKIHPDAKIIVGNRLHNPKEMPLIRLLTNKFLSLVISKLIDIHIPDTQCGFRLVHKDVFNLDLKSNRFEFESEMLAKASRVGYKIVSVPIQCIYHKNRKSKINPIRDSLKYMKMLWKIRGAK